MSRQGHLTAAGFRVTVARLVLLTARRKEIERLFARTAAAFGCQVPAPTGFGANRRLREYARFTRKQAETAMESGADLPALEQHLFNASLGLGSEYRLRFGIRSGSDAMAAARLIYSALGIDLKGDSHGNVTVRRCAFASAYTPRICRLMSSMDKGLLAGLTHGGELQFLQRLTDGAPACLARVTGGNT